MKSRIQPVMDSSPQVPGGLSPRLPGTIPADREEVARLVNEAMGRFGLILSVLEELGKELVPAAGDSDIRHGCERALTTILAKVATLNPAPVTSSPPGPQEKKAKTWLEGDRPARLIDPDRLGVLWCLIRSLFPVEGEETREGGSRTFHVH